MNGVVYAVSEQELKATNQREQGYTPTDITSDVEILGGGPRAQRQSVDLRQRFQERRAAEVSAQPPVSHRAIVRRYLPDRLPGN